MIWKLPQWYMDTCRIKVSWRLQKTIWFKFIMKFQIWLYGEKDSIFHDFGMQLLKNYTVKWYENHHGDTWGHVQQESGGVCRKQFDFNFLWIFKSWLYSEKQHSSWFWQAIIKEWYSKMIWESPQWYMGTCRTRVLWRLQKTIWFKFFMNFQIWL